MNIIKNTYKAAVIAVVAVGGVLLTSCSEDLPAYKDSVNRLNFNFGNEKIYSEKDVPTEAYSFVYSGGLSKDTVWVKVDLMGFPVGYDRTISVKQVEASGDNAVAGKHFVAFDDPTLTPFYVLKAGEVSAKVPVVVLRDESLSKKPYFLDIVLVENEEFKAGYPVHQVKHIEISNILAKPTIWDTYDYAAMPWYFCNWGPVAHQFMIDVTGYPFDNEFIKSLMDTKDEAYIEYFAEKVARAKVEYNKAHPDKPLQEADGTLVKFAWEKYL